MIKVNCKQCKKEFFTQPNRLIHGRGIYCSKDCHNMFQKGKKPWNYGIKSEKLSKAKSGKNNPMWKGGVSKKEQNRRYRNTIKGKKSAQKGRKKFYLKEENKEKRRKWVRDRIKSNIHFHLKRTISNGIWIKLKRRKSVKDSKISECLPYTIKELKEHLENLFLPEMTWDNYGEWHIDHKIPDSSFNYSSTKDKEFQDSWSLSNLQPLWGVDNIKKGSKLL